MKIKLLRHLLIDSNMTPTRAGTVVEVDDGRAKELIAAGLAEQDGTKAAASHDNKMASEPTNKSSRGRRASGGDE